MLFLSVQAGSGCMGESEGSPSCDEPQETELVGFDSQRVLAGLDIPVAVLWERVREQPVEITAGSDEAAAMGTMRLTTTQDMLMVEIFEDPGCGPEVLKVANAQWEVETEEDNVFTTDPGLFAIGTNGSPESLARWEGSAGPGFAAFHGTVQAGAPLYVYQGCFFEDPFPCGLTATPENGPDIKLGVGAQP